MAPKDTDRTAADLTWEQKRDAVCAKYPKAVCDEVEDSSGNYFWLYADEDGDYPELPNSLFLARGTTEAEAWSCAYSRLFPEPATVGAPAAVPVATETASPSPQFEEWWDNNCRELVATLEGEDDMDNCGYKIAQAAWQTRAALDVKRPPFPFELCGGEDVELTGTYPGINAPTEPVTNADPLPQDEPLDVLKNRMNKLDNKHAALCLHAMRTGENEDWDRAGKAADDAMAARKVYDEAAEPATVPASHPEVHEETLHWQDPAPASEPAPVAPPAPVPAPQNWTAPFYPDSTGGTPAPPSTLTDKLTAARQANAKRGIPLLNIDELQRPDWPSSSVPAPQDGITEAAALIDEALANMRVNRCKEACGCCDTIIAELEGWLKKYAPAPASEQPSPEAPQDGPEVHEETLHWKEPAPELPALDVTDDDGEEWELSAHLACRERQLLEALTQLRQHEAMEQLHLARLKKADAEIQELRGKLEYYASVARLRGEALDAAILAATPAPKEK